MAKKKTDAQVLAHLAKHAPHIMEAEIDFDALVAKVISADPDSIGLRPKCRKGGVMSKSRRTSATPKESK